MSSNGSSGGFLALFDEEILTNELIVKFLDLLLVRASET